MPAITRFDAGVLDVASLLGRLLAAPLFIVSGYGKLVSFAAAAKIIAPSGFPIELAPSIALALFELVCGVLLVLGFKTRWMALGLLSLVGAGMISAVAMETQPLASLAPHLLRESATLSGLLLLAALGGGRLSLDGWRIARPMLAAA